MAEPLWIIRRKGQRNDYWRNTGDVGWVSLDEATLFTATEANDLKLPKDGYLARDRTGRTKSPSLTE